MKTILLLEDLPEIRAWLGKLVLEVFPGAHLSESARVHDANLISVDMGPPNFDPKSLPFAASAEAP